MERTWRRCTHSFIRQLLLSRLDALHWSHEMSKMCSSSSSSRSSQPKSLVSHPSCNMNSFKLCSNDLTSFWVWVLIHEESRLKPLPRMGTSLSSYELLMSIIQLIFSCVFHVPDTVFCRDSRTKMPSLPLKSGREEHWLENKIPGGTMCRT